MDIVCLHDKAEIESCLRREVALNIYSLGDLDEFFWPYTQWYALKTAGEIQVIALLYTATSPPVLLALSPADNTAQLRELLSALLPLLPRKVYTHLSLRVEDVLAASYDMMSYGIHQKMILQDRACFQAFLSSSVNPLTSAHLQEILALYRTSYPENAFDPRMLETGQCFGVWEGNQLVSVAGVHVYSPVYRVAAIGNVTTHPNYRNRGLAKSVTAALCQSLVGVVDHIGLNVKQENFAAVECYRQLGFEACGFYHEIMASLKMDKGDESLYAISCSKTRQP
ncbi:MAG TPA: GNAT family N-acetyltransferase [Anaerolineales bacterium]|nr:GNAT family N-acetyltransferase [Anaerolineales bacterium]